MNRISKDPLLAVAQVILSLGVALFIFVMAMMAIGLGALLTVQRGEILAKIADAGAPDTAYWATAGALALLIVLFGAILRFVLELIGIVKSVERGDPFEPENANRLSRMGWIALAAYGIAMLVGGIAAWIKAVGGDAAANLDVEIGFDGGGLLLILTLFILARVFRKGAEMREELEGTV